MRMKFLLFAGAAVAGLSACDADGQLGAEGSPAWFMRTTAAEQAAFFTTICQTYGFSGGSPEMAQCVATEARDARRSASNRMQQIFAEFKAEPNN